MPTAEVKFYWKVSILKISTFCRTTQIRTPPEGPRDQALKVTICGVPLSVDDSAIHEMLIKLGVSNSPHSRGVTILFKKEFSFKFIYQHRSNDGRIILLNIEHDNKNITLINIYAPNTENLRSDFSKRFLNGYRNIV